MSRDTWYYAIDNTEQGPVSAQELKALAATEKITPRTLVWQEGLSDWVAAEKVPGLFAGNSAPASAHAPAPTAPERVSKAPAAKAADPLPRAPDPAAAAAAAHRVRQPAISFAQLSRWLRPLAWAAFALGVFSMLTARGCDALSNRYPARLQALSQVAELQFRDDWEATRTDLEAQRDDAVKRKDNSAADVFSERLKALSDTKTAEQEKLRRGTWRTLAQSARDAEANAKMWGFWREGLFLFGLGLLTLGAAVMSYFGAGAERWFFLVMLGGVIFSLLGSAVSFRFGS